jgi:hypothetical protein
VGYAIPYGLKVYITERVWIFYSVGWLQNKISVCMTIAGTELP